MIVAESMAMITPHTLSLLASYLCALNALFDANITIEGSMYAKEKDMRVALLTPTR